MTRAGSLPTMMNQLTLLDALPVGALVLDRDHNIQLANRSFRDLVRLPFEAPIHLEDLLRQIPFYVTDEVPYPADRPILKKAFEGKATWVESFKLKLHDRVLNCEGWVTPVADDDGVINQVLITVADRDASERSRDALRRALAQAADESAEQKKARSRLASASHEIRSPLTAILGFARELNDEALLPEPQQRKLRYILDSAQHLQDVIDNMLDLGRTGADEAPVRTKCVNLRKAMGWLEDMYRQRKSELDFRVKLADDLPEEICCDQSKLRQILINLLDNAFKMTDEGGVTLSISRGRRRNDLAFEVRDTGVGIREETLKHLFRDFSQGKEGRARGGLGLGLALCHRLATRMGGKLRVRSRPGEGSTFTLLIPNEQDAAKEAPAKASAIPIDEVAADLGRLKRNERRRLAEAVACCDVDEIVALANGIAARLPNLARCLHDLCERFAFQDIVELISRSEKAEADVPATGASKPA